MTTQLCSEDCLNHIGRGEHAEISVWHHVDCPNHSSACCTPPDNQDVYYAENSNQPNQLFEVPPWGLESHRLDLIFAILKEYPHSGFGSEDQYPIAITLHYPGGTRKITKSEK